MTQFNPDYSCGVGSILGDWIDGNNKTTEEAAKSLGIYHSILCDILTFDRAVNGFFIQKVANYTGIPAKTLTTANYRHYQFLLSNSNS